MIGLKSFLKEFSKLSGGELTHDALFARQRELVRCGLLPVREGRGPGSGVPLTPDTFATFLIGLLATDSLTDLGERTAQLCKARPLEFAAKKGSWRPRTTFHSDVAKALVGDRIAGYIPLLEDSPDSDGAFYLGIQVTRPWRGMILCYQPLQMPDGTKRNSTRGYEYTLGQEAKKAASVLPRTVSIEQELFWATSVSLERFMREDSK
jgi:hypothetical protein